MQIHRSEDRGQTRIDWLKSYHSFSFGDYYDPEHMQFRSLRVINEDFIAPASGFGSHPHRNMEIITYVVSGTLSHKDSLGTQQELKAGEVQRMSAGRGIIHSEWNASPETPVHLLQIWILPERQGIEPNYEQRLIEKKGALTKLVGRNDDAALDIHQDAEIFRASLAAGESIDEPVRAGLGAWFQLISGSVAVNGQVLNPGDACALDDPRTISLKALADSEGLLFKVP